MSSQRLYRLLRPLARSLALVFHRRLTIEHPERVPAAGPVVLAANHPNMLLDVLLLAASVRRELHFLAKATLFENPLLGRFLSAAGVLPVHRRRDERGPNGPAPGSGNLATFAACHELLAAGGAIAIFPEGVSHERDFVLPLKTGCARIVLEAESRRGFSLGTRVVPVGIAFSNRERFRSDALVRFGEPIDPAPYFEACREGREPEAVRALTAELERALRSSTLHVPREEDERLLATLRQIFAGPEITERVEVDRILVEAIAEFRDRRPRDYARRRREVLAYGRMLSLLGLTHGELDPERTYRTGAVVGYLTPRLLVGLAGLVPFLAGAALHYLPYSIPRWVAESRASEPVELATFKLATGLVTFPLAYGLVALAAGHFLGVLAAVLVLVLLPPVGLFTLWYLERSTELLREVRLFFFHVAPDERIERVRAWRNRLAGELLREKVDYLERRGVENHPEG